MRIISFSALALAVLASAALAEELADAPMDQITAGGVFELTADQLDSSTSAPVGPLRRNVIGAVGMLLEALLSEAFSSQQSLLRDVASAATPLNLGSPPGSTPISGLGSTPISGLGSTPISGLGSTPISGLGSTPISGLGSTPI